MAKNSVEKYGMAYKPDGEVVRVEVSGDVVRGEVVHGVMVPGTEQQKPPAPPAPPAAKKADG